VSRWVLVFPRRRKPSSSHILPEVAIDPNVRVHGNQTYASRGDIYLLPGTRVWAVEAESGLQWPAVVSGFDEECIYLRVDWHLCCCPDEAE